MSKVKIFDGTVRKSFQDASSWIFGVLSGILIFIDIPDQWKIKFGILIVALLVIVYTYLWIRANTLRSVTIDVDGSTINVITGDIFKQDGFKAIAFNEYFDTLVDDAIISKISLNGIFIQNYLNCSLEEFDNYLSNYKFDVDDIDIFNIDRNGGKKQKYKLGTVCVYNDYLLTAMTKFDNDNKAHLTMPDYLEFLINFWDKVNKIYAQKSVSTTIFGSGITRILGHKNISDEDLLKIMIWTFRISEMRFKYPAKLTIVIHEDKIDRINLLDIQAVKNGI